MEPLNDASIANQCLNILSNGRKLPSYAYYEPGDDVKGMFWNELSRKELLKIYRYIKKLQKK
jgi:hypothetical protein